MSEEQKNPERRRLTQKEVEQLRRKRDLAYKRKLQEIRTADDTEERQEIYDTLHRTRTVDKPQTIAKKVENYWYHYAFTTLVVIALIGVVAWFIHDMVTNEKYDMNLLVLSAGPYVEEYGSLQETLTKYMDDYDEDGNVDIYIDNIELDRDQIDSTDYQVVMAMTTKYTTALSSGDYVVYLLDQQYYDFLIESGLSFVDLSQYSSAQGVDGVRYHIANDEDFAGLTNKDDLFLVVRDLDDMAKKDKEKVVERHARDLEMVKQIIAE